jgi:hypothetical protein
MRNWGCVRMICTARRLLRPNHTGIQSWHNDLYCALLAAPYTAIPVHAGFQSY